MKEIQLTQGKVALVDDDVYDELNRYKWNAQKRKNIWYAARSGARNVLMHRVITNAPNGMVVDHINMDGLCNLRENLRVCTPADNQHNRGKNKLNTSGYKGVYKHGNKWKAEVQINGKSIYFGSWDTPEDAARGYDEGVIKYHGEYARLNFK